MKIGVRRIGNDQFQGSINDLGISHIYVNANEMVHSKFCHIIWKNSELYKCIVILICGFHQLPVKQRLNYKRPNCIGGIKEWCINAGVIAPASAAQAKEQHHDCRWMHLHKECFDVLVRCQKVKSWLFFQNFGET